MKDWIVQSLALQPRFAVLAAVATLALLASQLAIAGPDLLAPGGVLALGLAWGAAVDLERLRLPDAITLGLVVIGLLFAMSEGPHALMDAAIGCVGGYVSGWLLAEIFWRLRGREGLGLGDVKLLAAAGAWLGWQALPLAVLAASLTALIVVLALAALRRISLSASPKVPFGPFLALGIWCAWLSGLAGRV